MLKNSSQQSKKGRATGSINLYNPKSPFAINCAVIQPKIDQKPPSCTISLVNSKRILLTEGDSQNLTNSSSEIYSPKVQPVYMTRDIKAAPFKTKLRQKSPKYILTDQSQVDMKYETQISASNQEKQQQQQFNSQQLLNYHQHINRFNDFIEATNKKNNFTKYSFISLVNPSNSTAICNIQTERHPRQSLTNDQNRKAIVISQPMPSKNNMTQDSTINSSSDLSNINDPNDNQNNADHPPQKPTVQQLVVHQPTIKAKRRKERSTSISTAKSFTTNTSHNINKSKKSRSKTPLKSFKKPQPILKSQKQLTKPQPFLFKDKSKRPNEKLKAQQYYGQLICVNKSIPHFKLNIAQIRSNGIEDKTKNTNYQCKSARQNIQSYLINDDQEEEEVVSQKDHAIQQQSQVSSEFMVLPDDPSEHTTDKYCQYLFRKYLD